MKLSPGDLLARRGGLVVSSGDVEQILFGSLVEQTRRCGKTGCRCADGMPHGPYSYLTTRLGRRGMRYGPAALMPLVDAYLRRGEQVEGVLAEISSFHVELLGRRDPAQPSPPFD